MKFIRVSSIAPRNIVKIIGTTMANSTVVAPDRVRWVLSVFLMPSIRKYDWKRSCKLLKGGSQLCFVGGAVVSSICNRGDLLECRLRIGKHGNAVNCDAGVPLSWKSHRPLLLRTTFPISRSFIAIANGFPPTELAAAYNCSRFRFCGLWSHYS